MAICQAPPSRQDGSRRVLKLVLKQLHLALVYTMLVFVVLHVLAVLKHQLIDRDSLLRRMLP